MMTSLLWSETAEPFRSGEQQHEAREADVVHQPVLSGREPLETEEEGAEAAPSG
jgi:hypothetical protein